MFELVSKYSPSGDQPEAIKRLVQGIKDGKKEQVLLGATGTGKTFTIANVINAPALDVNKFNLKSVNNLTVKLCEALNGFENVNDWVPKTSLINAITNKPNP